MKNLRTPIGTTEASFTNKTQESEDRPSGTEDIIIGMNIFIKEHVQFVLEF